VDPRSNNDRSFYISSFGTRFHSYIQDFVQTLARLNRQRGWRVCFSIYAILQADTVKAVDWPVQLQSSCSPAARNPACASVFVWITDGLCRGSARIFPARQIATAPLDPLSHMPCIGISDVMDRHLDAKDHIRIRCSLDHTLLQNDIVPNVSGMFFEGGKTVGKWARRFRWGGFGTRAPSFHPRERRGAY
jgi:hypothetical protein